MSDIQTFDLASASVGDVLVERTIHLTRESLVRYAGASNDFNPIHYRDDIAEQVGLPGVLAHGMLTMGLAIQPVISVLGGPDRVLSYRTKFTKPVVVDPVEGAELTVRATLGALADDEGVCRIDLDVQCAEQKVLGRAQVKARVGGGAAAAGAAAGSGVSAASAEDAA